MRLQGNDQRNNDTFGQYSLYITSEYANRPLSNRPWSSMVKDLRVSKTSIFRVRYQGRKYKVYYIII